MTTIERPARREESANPLDVRCGTVLDRPRSAEGRCQLLAGHAGPHALLFIRTGQRMLLTWLAGPGRDAHDVRACSDAVMTRPWMRGYPMPAWSEAGPAE